MKTILEDIIKNSSNKLTSEILNVILENDNTKETIQEIIKKGIKCSSVAKFNDTNYIKYIFDTYYDEIEHFRKIASKSEDFCEILNIGDIKKYFVHFAIKEIITDLYDDLFIKKLQKIALINHNTLTSKILGIIINNKQAKVTFESLVENKSYQTVLLALNEKDFYHKLFDTHYIEIDNTINDLVHCGSEIEIARMSDIKIDLLCIVIDFILAGIDDEMRSISKKESRF